MLLLSLPAQGQKPAGYPFPGWMPALGGANQRTAGMEEPTVLTRYSHPSMGWANLQVWLIKELSEDLGMI